MKLEDINILTTYSISTTGRHVTQDWMLSGGFCIIPQHQWTVYGGNKEPAELGQLLLMAHSINFSLH